MAVPYHGIEPPACCWHVVVVHIDYVHCGRQSGSLNVLFRYNYYGTVDKPPRKLCESENRSKNCNPDVKKYITPNMSILYCRNKY